MQTQIIGSVTIASWIKPKYVYHICNSAEEFLNQYYVRSTCDKSKNEVFYGVYDIDSHVLVIEHTIIYIYC